ncbi:MAG: DUF72 domain-containing protein [Candidatus Eisenbacteria bacterium]|uniref:DUF72 domain-containing protein n=1 Tax=Eiseniibacteriota bacterium TaxID=2212470 RepID=A0A538SJM8_UNCEI|nr:MAG: DUF72 domain-containing protein [Candidatus Eisenbacteria bacterium]
MGTAKLVPADPGTTIIYRARIRDAPMVHLRFGCSGWDYQEWIGPVYRNASESKLRAYSRIFDTAEINSTFYRAPSPGMVQGWARFTPEDFVFAAKVPQTVTHDRLLDVAAGADKDLLAYCELMRPLLDAGKLGPLLLQLPPRLRFQETVIHRFLDTLPRAFTFALEPRNKSWMTLEAFDLLRATGVAYTIVDEPLLPPDLHVTAPFAYLRWHGHGTDPWYNYRYTEEELKDWVPRVQQVAGQAETVYGFFNNHFHGYAPENCLQILRMLGVQTQEHARALQRIDGFRKVATPAEVRLRSLTLEDFGADVPKDALVEAALERFMDRNRLDRAKRIDSKEVEISRDGQAILARVKDYRVELDLGAQSILHDCEDWGKLVDRKDFCKHVGKFFLSLPKQEALARLDQITANRDAWTFATPKD